METKICKICGKKINKIAEICPYCGCRVKSNVLKTILICLIVIIVLVSGYIGISFINTKITEKNKNDEIAKKNEQENRIYGRWKLINETIDNDEFHIDKELLITDKNYINGIHGIDCIGDDGNRINDCEYVQKSYGLENEYRIDFGMYLCFYIEDDYLIEKNCTYTVNGEYEGNLNLKYEKISDK